MKIPEIRLQGLKSGQKMLKKEKTLLIPFTMLKMEKKAPKTTKIRMF